VDKGIVVGVGEEEPIWGKHRDKRCCVNLASPGVPSDPSFGAEVQGVWIPHPALLIEVRERKRGRGEEGGMQVIGVECEYTPKELSVWSIDCSTSTCFICTVPCGPSYKVFNSSHHYSTPSPQLETLPLIMICQPLPQHLINTPPSSHAWTYSPRRLWKINSSLRHACKLCTLRCGFTPFPRRTHPTAFWEW
jgi:hypothetical protein